MVESKILSSAGFRHAFSVEELYVVTTHWLSDVAFFEQEINYFESLIARYFLPHAGKENVTTIVGLANRFKSLKDQKDYLKASIAEHRNDLSVLLGKRGVENEAHYNSLHSKFEAKLFDFIKSLRQVKLEFFSATKFSDTSVE